MEGAEDVMALHAEFGPAGYQVNILDLAGAQLGAEGVSKVLAFVVLTRRNGLMLAIPEFATRGEVLADGLQASAEDLVALQAG